MELNTLGELMRDEAQDAASPGSEVEPLVAGALRRGRRTVVRQRVAATAACCALLVAGAAVVIQLPGRTVAMAPAGPPTAAAEPKPTPSTPTQPTPSTPTQPAPGDVEAPAVQELLALFQEELSDRFRYSEISDDREPMAGEVAVAFTLTDRKGKSWAGGGIDNEIDNLRCVAADGCTRQSLAGGEVLVMRTPDSMKKAGEGTWYYFKRSDGSWLWFGQNNAFEGKGPVTRATLPLSKAEVFALLTASAWDPLVERCRAAGPAC
jgi:hypothetical protein